MMLRKLNQQWVWIIPIVTWFTIGFLAAQHRDAQVDEEHMTFTYRQQLEEMLVHDEVGSTTVTHMLTVTHDGKSALVVGIGHDVLPEDNLELGDTISLDRATILFDADVHRAITIARNVIDGFDSHPADLQIVTCALAFQLGEKGLKSFTHMLNAIKERDYATAAKHLLDSKLAREQSHQRATREANLLKGLAKKVKE